MKLMREYIDHKDLEFLTEGTDSEKTYRIKGPFICTEVKNGNGRIYGKPLIERELSKYQTKIKENRSLGELDHPPQPTVNLDRVSHIIESLSMNGNDAHGIARILDTPTGRIAKSLLKEGIKLGVSTRGVGSLNGNKVNDDFGLICVDIVADPSGPSAFVEGILENKEYIMEGNKLVEIAIDNMKRTLDSTGSKYLKEAMMEFIQKISRR